MTRPIRIETLAVQSARFQDAPAGAVAAPIILSTTFERAADGTFPHGYIYSRSGNPNREHLERCLTALEGGRACIAFGSGSAATAAAFQSLSPGDHVIAPSDAYYGTAKLLNEVFGPWGLQASYADMSVLGELERAFRPNTKLVWIETPSNPLLKVTDIKRVAAMAHARGARVVCDNTWATPVLQRPFELGADVVMHATTKYLGGHSDVLGGALVVREDDDFAQRIRLIQTTGGAVPSPFECWLVVRSIRSLPLRVRAQADSAARVARHLEQHPAVEVVHYPGLERHPGYEVAKKQMSAFGGMLSFQVKGGREAAMRVAAGVRIFTRATSLGGCESLIEHRASVEGPASKTPANLLRVSVGLENAEDLIADLSDALA